MNPSTDVTRPLTLNMADAWAVHDCLAGALAGFGGRSETASPWHAESLMRKLAVALLRFEPPEKAAAVDLDLTEGELRCIDLNVPRTAYAGATALLLRVFRALAELDWGMALLPADQEPAEARARLARWEQTHVEPFPEG